MDFEKISGLGIGTWAIGEDPAKRKDEIAAIRYGLDNGLNIIDTADMKELFSVPGGTECFANEDLYNLNERGTEFDLQDWQKEKQVNFIGYSPYNSGKGNTIRITRNLKMVARNHGVTPHQVMLAWTMRNGNVLTIPKASSIKHMKENIEAQKIKLTDDDLRLINSDFPIPTEKSPLSVI